MSPALHLNLPAHDPHPTAFDLHYVQIQLKPPDRDLESPGFQCFHLDSYDLGLQRPALDLESLAIPPDSTPLDLDLLAIDRDWPDSDAANLRQTGHGLRMCKNLPFAMTGVIE